MSYKVLVIQTDHSGCDCYGECCCEPEIKTQEMGLLDLAKCQDWELKQAVQGLVLQALESGDEMLRMQLRQKGWVNVKEIKDREEKLAAGKQYWMYQGGHSAYGVRLSPIDLENISVHTARQLANEDTHVVQAVTKTSVKKLMDRGARKAYDDEAVRLKKDKEKRAAAAKARREKKKQKEIEKAKKILAEAGEK